MTPGTVLRDQFEKAPGSKSSEDDVEEIHDHGEEGDEPMDDDSDGGDDDKLDLHDSSISAFYGSKVSTASRIQSGQLVCG